MAEGALRSPVGEMSCNRREHETAHVCPPCEEVDQAELDPSYIRCMACREGWRGQERHTCMPDDDDEMDDEGETSGVT